MLDVWSQCGQTLNRNSTTSPSWHRPATFDEHVPHRSFREQTLIPEPLDDLIAPTLGSLRTIECAVVVGYGRTTLATAAQSMRAAPP